LAPRPFWKGAENLAIIRARFPDRPARSEQLYRRGYPGLQNNFAGEQKFAIVIELFLRRREPHHVKI